MSPRDKPLTNKQLRAITSDGEFFLQVAVPVSFEDLLGGDIDALNDQVSEAITGSAVDLQDLSFERYVPSNESDLHDVKQGVYVLVVADWAPTDGMGE